MATRWGKKSALVTPEEEQRALSKGWQRGWGFAPVGECRITWLPDDTSTLKGLKWVKQLNNTVCISIMWPKNDTEVLFTPNLAAASLPAAIYLIRPDEVQRGRAAMSLRHSQTEGRGGESELASSGRSLNELDGHTAVLINDHWQLTVVGEAEKMHSGERKIKRTGKNGLRPQILSIIKSKFVVMFIKCKCLLLTSSIFLSKQSIIQLKARRSRGWSLTTGVFHSLLTGQKQLDAMETRERAWREPSGFWLKCVELRGRTTSSHPPKKQTQLRNFTSEDRKSWLSIRVSRWTQRRCDATISPTASCSRTTTHAAPTMATQCGRQLGWHDTRLPSPRQHLATQIITLGHFSHSSWSVWQSHSSISLQSASKWPLTAVTTTSCCQTTDRLLVPVDELANDVL